MWFDESVFYQIYPLGFCGAERENDFGDVRHRLGKIQAEIPRLKALGVTAVLFNPLFESERHGYDTVDFFRVDRRLGTNAELKDLIKRFHEAGIRVVLDGVFNHVGRKFAPFEEVRRLREGTDYRFWFQIDFRGDSRYHDGFGYELLVPSTTTPSSGIFSPGLTRMISPTCTSPGSILCSSPSRSTFA